MLKLLAVGLSLAAIVYPFNAAAQYGKVLKQPDSSFANQASPVSKSDTKSSVNKQQVQPKQKTDKQTQNTKNKTVHNSTKASAPQVVMSDDDTIDIFFDDFSIKRTMAGQISCHMTFYVSNNTDKSLDSFYANLNWPGIATNIAFMNISPNDLKTIRYALAGEGCYTMGAVPDVEVNRCIMRAKDSNGNIVDVPEDMCKKIVRFK